MGLRGPQPTLQIRSEPLADLSAPDWLDEVSAGFWAKHAPQLKANQLLTEQTAESFALLCELWSRVRIMSAGETSRAYLDTVKAYQSAAKLFRLIPNEKPQVKEHRFADMGVIDV